MTADLYYRISEIFSNKGHFLAHDHTLAHAKDVPISTHAPDMNCFAERCVGSIRREALDWFALVNENQVRRIVKDYVRYYNELRPHQGLDQGVPTGYVSLKRGKVKSKPVLSGLHHHYYRAA